LLTAALVGGGPMEVPGVQMEGMSPLQGIYMPPDTEPRGILYRIGCWLHHNEGESYPAMNGGPVMYINKPAVMQAMPEMQSTAEMPVNDAPALTTAEPPIADPVTPASAKVMNAEVKKEFQNKVGHAEDYSWITGQLFYVHADGGVWVLRYASVSEEDRYGGSAVLAPAVNMKNYREGDLVSVNGEVLDQGRASRHLGGCLFRASSIDLIERAD
jgi:hypothetical protein